MPNPTDHPFLSDRLRNWLYPVTLAVVALLGGYGIIGSEEIALWGALAAALLGTGTATAYRPTKTVEPLKAREQVRRGEEEARRAGWRSPDEMGG